MCVSRHLRLLCNAQESVLIAANSEVPALSPKAGRHSFERSFEAARSGSGLSARVSSQPIGPLSVRIADTSILENEEEGAPTLESHPVSALNHS